MKKFALALSLLCAACGLTFAGSEPMASGKEMKQVVPPAPECPSFAGFYGGIFGGYVRSNVDLDLDLTGAWENFEAGFEGINDHQPGSLDNDGGELGGLIGYNFLFGNHWVFGLEAAGSYLWARDSDFEGTFAVDQTDAYNLTNSFKTHYLFTVAPRIGYAFCRWMPYVTGGLAVGDLDYSWRLVNVGARESGKGTFVDNNHESETNAGWMVGGGVEYALTNHWHVRAQYQYTDLGSVGFHSAGTGGPNVAAARSLIPGVPEGFSASAFTADHEADLTEHHASVALIYQF